MLISDMSSKVNTKRKLYFKVVIFFSLKFCMKVGKGLGSRLQQWVDKCSILASYKWKYIDLFSLKLQ